MVVITYPTLQVHIEGQVGIAIIEDVNAIVNSKGDSRYWWQSDENQDYYRCYQLCQCSLIFPDQMNNSPENTNDENAAQRENAGEDHLDIVWFSLDAVVSEEAVDGEYGGTALRNKRYRFQELLHVVVPRQVVRRGKSQYLEVISENTHIDCGYFLLSGSLDVDVDQDYEVHYHQDRHTRQTPRIDVL